ncbi:hypothetical protein BDE02_12G071100 [Populus trichocarpa]|nr:hypothetical protein BDE02_12G071100 [Populus trichocarpa]
MRLHSIFKLVHLDLPLVQVLLEGLPPNALNEDIERFLSGCEFVPSSIRKYPDPVMSAGRKNPTTFEEKTDPTTSKGKQDATTS